LKKLRIIFEITDQEYIEEVKDIHLQLIADDFVNESSGYLIFDDIKYWAEWVD